MTRRRTPALKTVLRTAREEAGLSIRQLAERSGVDKAMISRIESGETKWAQLGTINKLATALDLEPNRLYEASGYFAGQALPSPAIYFRGRYGQLPDEAVADLERYVKRLQKKYGVRGPKPGEDEQPLAKTTRRTAGGRKK
jgi:transcriptional regulator with XRE-family HTH domain